MECTKVNCPMQAGTPTDNCGENCPWRTTAKTGDLISRAAAIDALTDTELRRNLDSVYDDDIKRIKRAAQRVIAQLPAVDAAPVVRCRDCKHFIDMSGTSYPSYCYKHSTFDAEGEFDNAFSVEPNKYCAWGERRDDDGKDA